MFAVPAGIYVAQAVVPADLEKVEDYYLLSAASGADHGVDLWRQILQDEPWIHWAQMIHSCSD